MNRRHGRASIRGLPTALALTLGLIPAAKAPAADPAAAERGDADRRRLVVPARRGLRRPGREDAELRPRGARGGAVHPVVLRLAVVHAVAGGILTGQAVHRLENGGNLWSVLPKKFACYPDLLEAAGYAVGLTGKGWGPGTSKGAAEPATPPGRGSGTSRRSSPASPRASRSATGTAARTPTGLMNQGTGAEVGHGPDAVAVPLAFPDTPEVRARHPRLLLRGQAVRPRRGRDPEESWTTAGLADEHARWSSRATTACPSPAARRTCTTPGRTCPWRCAGRGGCQRA